MIATEQISVQIPPTSTKVLENTGWHNEQQFISREPVFIHGLIGKQIMGQLNGHLIIEREVQGNQFQEKHRYVQLNDVTVHQLKDVKMRRRGLGTSMVRELEKITLKFGAAKITGIISTRDLENQPWLPKFYKQLGFILTENGGGYNLEKALG